MKSNKLIAYVTDAKGFKTVHKYDLEKELHVNSLLGVLHQISYGLEEGEEITFTAIER